MLDQDKGLDSGDTCPVLAQGPGENGQHGGPGCISLRFQSGCHYRDSGVCFYPVPAPLESGCCGAALQGTDENEMEDAEI